MIAFSGPYGPAALTSAYKLPSKVNTTVGTGQTIAVIDAYDDPFAASDLAQYRSYYGLRACTAGSGCFRKVNQAGATSPMPASDVGWAGEISVDLDMASAICPNCHLLLVEAASSLDSDLATSVNTAVGLGATILTNSYGATETSQEVASLGPAYNHPGVTVTVASGDAGFAPGAQFPADLPTVLAVGGTRLTRNLSTPRGWVETGWDDSGSGCSSYVPMTIAQTLRLPQTRRFACASSFGGSPGRQIADVSAVADPATGVAVYDSFGSGGFNWWIFGGTSVASPIIAGIVALAGNAASITPPVYRLPYRQPPLFNDIRGGSSGSCGGSYICAGRGGYDGPTGIGTPIGRFSL